MRDWWIFYTYYDIISTWTQNYDMKNGNMVKKSNFTGNYYLVKQAYNLAYYEMLLENSSGVA